MGFAQFNGGMINGARVVAALAFVNCTASAQVDASVSNTRLASSVVAASASVAAKPFSYLFGDSSALVGQSHFLAQGAHLQSGEWASVAQATLIAYSVRSVLSQSELGGYATATFIPASILAWSDVLAGSSIAGEATKIQPGHVAFDVAANVLLGDPTAYRMVMADLLGSTEWRAESGINGVYEAYWDPAALSEVVIDDIGLVTKQVGALIYGVSYTTAHPTMIQKCKADTVASGELVPQPVLIKRGQTSVLASAEILASSEYQFKGAANPGGSAALVNQLAQQKHMAAVPVLGGEASITSNPPVLRMVQATVLGSVSCVGDIEYWVSLQGQVSATVEIEGLASVYHHWWGDADLLASGGMSPIGYENLMAPMNPAYVFTRPKSTREFKRSESSRTFWRA